MWQENVIIATKCRTRLICVKCRKKISGRIWKSNLLVACWHQHQNRRSESKFTMEPKSVDRSRVDLPWSCENRSRASVTCQGDVKQESWATNKYQKAGQGASVTPMRIFFTQGIPAVKIICTWKTAVLVMITLDPGLGLLKHAILLMKYNPRSPVVYR